MNNLGLFERKGNILVSSKLIAEHFKKRHDNITTTISKFIKNSQGYPFEKDTPVKAHKYINYQNG